MKPQAVREKADIELREELAALRKDLFHRRFRGATDEIEQRGRFGKLRREVARIATVLRERELGVRGQQPVVGGAPRSTKPDKDKEKR
ncbi:MAG: 50S ribosomal protein L29 [Planctomycetota bacterium]